MSARKILTVRLEADDYRRLEAEARRLGMRTGALAREYVRARLNGGESTAERRRSGLEALDRLAELTADLPHIDAVRVARESREELEQRPFL